MFNSIIWWKTQEALLNSVSGLVLVLHTSWLVDTKNDFHMFVILRILSEYSRQSLAYTSFD